MPGDVRDELHHLLVPYRRAHREVRWVRPETWHLTLLFLGSVDPPRTAELRALVDDVGAQVAPYEAVADEGGGRAGRGDGVAWLGLSAGAASLIEVADLVAAACPSDITAGPPPKRTRSAHLTIARKADEALVRALRHQTHGPLRVAWRVDRLQLVRSHLGADGARYETLHESTL